MAPLKRVTPKILIALILISGMTNTLASTPGTNPFGLMKAFSLFFSTIGGTLGGVTSAFSSNILTIYGPVDGAYFMPKRNATDGTYLYVADGNARIVKLNASTGAFVGAIGKTNASTGTCPSSGAAPGWCTGGSFIQSGSDGGFSSVYSLAVDTAGGYLYATDVARVVKINLSTGAFIGAVGKTSGSTGTCPASGSAPAWCTGGNFMSGAGDGAFNLANSLAIDVGGGYLYVGEYYNHRVVRITLSTGAFAGAIGRTTASTGTCPGTGTATGWCTGGTFGAGTNDGAFNFVFGLAVDPSGGALYVTDYGNSRIVKITSSTGAFVGAIGKTTATTGTCPGTGTASGWCTGGTFTLGGVDGGFQYPRGISIDSVNNLLYVADSGRVSKHTLSTGAFLGAIGKTFSSTGTCPVSGVASGWCTGGSFTTGSNDGMYNALEDVLTDGISLYISDSYNHRIVKASASTGAFAGAVGGYLQGLPGWSTGTGNYQPGPADGEFNFGNGEKIAADIVNGILYFTDTLNHRVVKIDANTGAVLGAIGKTTASTGTCPASGIASGWCTGGTFAAASVDGAFNNPGALAIDTAGGFLYVGDRNNSRIVRVNLSSGSFAGAIGRTISSTGSCPATGLTTDWCAGGSFTSSPLDGAHVAVFGLALDKVNDFLYVASQWKISKLNLSTGQFVGSVGSTTASTGTCPPSGTATNWCTGGTFSAISADGAYNNPLAMSVDPANGFLFITENTRLMKLNASTGAFIGAIGKTTSSTGTCPNPGVATGWCTGGSFVVGNTDGAFNGVVGIAIDVTNNFLFVTDRLNNRLKKFNLSSGAFIGAIGKTTASTGTCPTGGIAKNWCTRGTFVSLPTGEGGFNSPTALELDPIRHILYVGDGLARIQRVK